MQHDTTLVIHRFSFFLLLSFCFSHRYRHRGSRVGPRSLPSGPAKYHAGLKGKEHCFPGDDHDSKSFQLLIHMVQPFHLHPGKAAHVGLRSLSSSVVVARHESAPGQAFKPATHNFTDRIVPRRTPRHCHKMPSSVCSVFRRSYQYHRIPNTIPARN